LKELHLEHVWVSEKIELGSNFNKLVSNLMKNKEENEWRERMQRKSKLRLYRKLKDTLVVEDYVIELEREKRRQLTMLRGGTNKLRIETGRWKKERENETVCKVCLCEQVEDEKHFLLACPMFVRERARMYARISEECELEHVESMDEEWQIQLLIGVGWREKNKRIRKIVLEYIRKAYNIRKKYVADM
jgi:hypothetical protein